MLGTEMLFSYELKWLLIDLPSLCIGIPLLRRLYRKRKQEILWGLVLKGELSPPGEMVWIACFCALLWLCSPPLRAVWAIVTTVLCLTLWKEMKKADVYGEYAFALKCRRIALLAFAVLDIWMTYLAVCWVFGGWSV